MLGLPVIFYYSIIQDLLLEAFPLKKYKKVLVILTNDRNFCKKFWLKISHIAIHYNAAPVLVVVLIGMDEAININFIFFYLQKGFFFQNYNIDIFLPGKNISYWNCNSGKFSVYFRVLQASRSIPSGHSKRISAFHAEAFHDILHNLIIFQRDSRFSWWVLSN